MQNGTDDKTLVQFHDRSGSHDAIVKDLSYLIKHVQASMRLIESAIASETPLGNQELAANVVVLDDITPCYVRANAALNACNAGLTVALHYLLDIHPLAHGTGEGAGNGLQQARAMGRA